MYLYFHIQIYTSTYNTIVIPLSRIRMRALPEENKKLTEAIDALKADNSRLICEQTENAITKSQRTRKKQKM
jgi:hypothetical protein